jgi:hypothetical protein
VIASIEAVYAKKPKVKIFFRVGAGKMKKSGSDRIARTGFLEK